MPSPIPMPMFNELPTPQGEKTSDAQEDELLIIEDEEEDDFLLIEEDIDKLTSQLNEVSKDQQEQTDETPIICSPCPIPESWKIIIVDDEPSVHHATQIALKNFTFEGHPIEFISAFSAKEGKEVISELHGQAASILLDVVMETSHAGLDLVDFIRNSLRDKQVRIILRTGQPGEAPPESVILNYDINDYQLKLDMTRQRLITTVVAALRSYRDLITIESQNSLLMDTLEKLQVSEQELKKYSHNLELIVSERTAELRQANEKLKRLATLDGLTQVANRQCFDDYLNEYWDAAIQNQTPISLLLLDVDYFKKYNDSYGHLAGDDCLKQVADALTNSLRRPDDIVARYGGEEFGILLPKCFYDGAIRVAGDVFDCIRGLKIPHNGSEIENFVTISMGVSSLIPHEQMQAASLIDMADLALYRAKDSGRNQFCLYRDIAEILPASKV